MTSASPPADRRIAPSPWSRRAFAQAPASVATLPGMPPVVDLSNLYSETAAGKLSPAVAGDLPRVYVRTCAATTST